MFKLLRSNPFHEPEADGLLADKKKYSVLQHSFFSGFSTSRSVLAFSIFLSSHWFLFLSISYPYPSLLFFSFIPSSAFVFSYLMIPSFRHMAPGAYDLQYVPSYLPIRVLVSLSVLLRAVLFTIPILPLNVFLQYRLSLLKASAVDHSVLSPPTLSTKRISEMHIHVHV